MRNTRQRETVLNTVLISKDHPSAETVYNRIHKDYPHISRATVYRNLTQLSETGKIRYLAVPGNSSDRYDWRLEDHSHLLCRCCGTVIDIAPVEDDHHADEQVALRSGYQDVQHSLIFSGICPECQKKKD
ncbi:MAG: transcriptional repressor [Erysipelotrichia bacterium]|nr:transcriptional repressor [Erysipelotrichia bacterium]